MMCVVKLVLVYRYPRVCVLSLRSSTDSDSLALRSLNKQGCSLEQT